ncbi:MAG: MotA/TolQ/ExbB proton channel family protein [Balneolales bacterium]|nr:MotA/TolQ/ExbB proton channel family protein [Balneolales bacterium]
MINLFFMGGPLFMGILTIIFISMIATAVYIYVQRGKPGAEVPSIGYVKEIAIFGLIFGIFGQFVGLYEAFSILEQVGEVSPSVLAGGLKVSTITTLYGFVIFITGWLIYFGLKRTESLNLQ